MSVSVLTYTRDSTIADTEDLLVQLEAFASGLGWTTDLQQSKVWADQGGGVYGWSAGDETYLELRSSGYGAQTLVYRFRWDITAAGTRGTLDYRGIDPTNATSDTSSTHPAYQNDYNNQTYYNRMSCPDGAYADGVYFFGNARFIAVFMGFYADAVAAFAFGLPDLNPDLQTEAEISFIWGGQYFPSLSATYYWDSMKSNKAQWRQFNYYSSQRYAIQWYQQAIEGGRSYDYTTNLWLGASGSPDGEFHELTELLKYNSFSDKRIGAQPTIILKNQGTGQWFPAGRLPLILVPYTGLAQGNEISYGAETFRVFPDVFQEYNYGVALRTA
jgi:hypothetical protein